MMMNHVGALKTWLKTSYCVTVPEDWLEACLEWIQEENPGSDVSLQSLKNQVYEQWLMSDLRELKMGCLPLELLEARKIEISGIFALQIDSAVNVGSSFYSQGQKIKGTENPNVQVSGEDTRQPAWEPKPTRMIVLKLTDGVSDVRGMEYNPVAALTPFITPGTKMLVKGKVLCRHGMLMLGPENVQILGGEVDSLVETHTPEAVLAAAMQAGQTSEGKSEKQEFSGRMLSKGEDKKGVAHMHHPGTTSRSAPGFKQETIKRETAQHTQQYSSTRNMSVGRQGNPTAHQSSVKREMTDPDDWGEDFDYDALMADMEDEGTAQTNTGGHQPAHHIKTEPPSQQQTSAGRPTNQTDHMGIGEDVFMDDFDDDFDIQTSFSRTVKQEVKQEPVSQHSRTMATSGVDQDRKMDADRPNQSILQNRKQTVSSLTGIDPKRGKNELRERLETGQVGLGIITAQNRPARQPNNDRKGSAYVADEDFEEDFDFDVCDVNASKTLNSFNGVQAKRMRFDSPAEDPQKPSETMYTKHKVKPCPEDGQVCNKTDVPKAVIHPFSNLTNMKTVGSATPVQSNQGSRSASRNQGQSRMDRFLGGGSSPSQSAPPVEGNFMYLSEILSTMPVTETKEFVIKGYISTLTSKLTSCQGKTWSLSCKVNDGTAALNVDLANSVLTKLIGFSAEDSVVMKQRAKRDPTVKEVLTEGLQQCQQQLTDLSSLMKIQFQPHQPKPVLCQIIPVTTCHAHCLYNQIINKKWIKR